VPRVNGAGDVILSRSRCQSTAKHECACNLMVCTQHSELQLHVTTLATESHNVSQPSRQNATAKSHQMSLWSHP